MLSIRNRLILGFGLILLFILVKFVVVYSLLSQSQTLVEQAIDRDFQTSVEVARIGMEAHKMRRFEKEYLIYVASPGKRDGYFTEWKAARDVVRSTIDRIIENSDQRWSEAELAMVRDWQKALKAYADGFMQVVTAAENGSITSTVQGNEAVANAKNAFKPLLDGTAIMIDQKYSSADSSAKDIDGKFRVVKYVLVMIGLAGVMLCLYMLLKLPESIAQPIEALTRAAHDMSTGNLDKTVSIAGTPEFKELGETLERMRVSQKMIIDRLKGKLNPA